MENDVPAKTFLEKRSDRMTLVPYAGQEVSGRSMRPTKKWSYEEEQQLRLHVIARTRTKVIAGLMGRPFFSIKSKRERIWVPLKDRVPDTVWTEEMVGRLTADWGQGREITQISVEFSTRYDHDFTRNSIAGKLDRLGLFGTRPRNRKPPRLRTGAFRRVPPPPPSGALVRAFLDMPDRACMFITDDARTLMCGEPTIKGAYCAHHYDLCHKKPAHKHGAPTNPPGAPLGAAAVTRPSEPAAAPFLPEGA